MTNILIFHGIWDSMFDRIYWRNTDYYELPFKFRDLLRDKGFKWNDNLKKRSYPLIPFTLGVDGDIMTIAIVHPWDSFKIQTGIDIVRGRINRQLGLMNRPTYDRIAIKFDRKMENIIYKEVPPYIITGD